MNCNQVFWLSGAALRVERLPSGIGRQCDRQWAGEGGEEGGREREEAVIQLKSLVTLVSQSLNLHIVM